MRTLSITLVTAVACTAATAALAQTKVDRAFTTAGRNCSDVKWSPETLARYPTIGKACEEVMEKDGKHYVKFEGEITKVADRGQKLTVDFDDAGKLLLTPPPNLVVYVDGRKSGPEALRPGDELSFYVPEDRLTANFARTAEEIETMPLVPIYPAEERVAMAEPEEELPRTAGFLPLVGLGGLVMLAFGMGLTVLRRRR